jgi:ubiquitin-activating enzyme E1
VCTLEALHTHTQSFVLALCTHTRAHIPFALHPHFKPTPSTHPSRTCPPKLRTPSFEEIEGATQLNGLSGLTAQRVFDPYGPAAENHTRLNPKRFRVCFPANCEVPAADVGAYIRGGIVTPHKKQKELAFLPLGQSLVTPGELKHPNPMKLLLQQRPAHLHFAYLALWEYQANHNGALPPLHDHEAAEECVKLAQAILEEHRSKEDDDVLTVEEIDQEVVRKTALYARSELSGVCAFLGGVVAQEIVKRFGKYTPIHQWLYLDYFELLPEAGPHPLPTTAPTRYSNQVCTV